MTHISARDLSRIYGQAHDLMRNIDGLQPQEAFDELLKYIFFKEVNEEKGPPLPPFQKTLLSNGSFGHDENGLLRRVRSLFASYLRATNSWSKELWLEKKFQLTDKALFALHQVFAEITLADISFDIRSAALKEFMPPEMRRGLGIYLTPDDVVRMTVEIAQPKKGSKVFDPACGSGTFLIETLKYWGKSEKREPAHIWGSDKNPRMLLLSELNIGHMKEVRFVRRLLDSLFDLPLKEDDAAFASPNSFDYIFTNPPFGVYLDGASHDLSRFLSCFDEDGTPFNRQQSEIVFLEQCLRLLKPGGVLSIVLPKSVITNVVARVSTARRVANMLGYVYAIVLLPPETFQHMAGTQTTTAVVFIRKYRETEKKDRPTRIAYACVKNVGYDATGRVRSGNELAQVSKDILKAIKDGKSSGLCTLMPEVALASTMESLPAFLSGKTEARKGGVCLRDIADVISTGRTPSRASYTDKGLFVIKVGNLTGNGINWAARDRNYVSEKERSKRMKNDLMVKKGDILLTSSAHTPVYIAKKVDIVHRIPEWLNDEASLVGEVMLIRLKIGTVNPYLLIPYLRAPNTMAEIQRMVRGQTAHLHPEDIGNLPIPDMLLKPPKSLERMASVIQKEADLSFDLNKLAREQALFSEEVF